MKRTALKLAVVATFFIALTPGLAYAGVYHTVTFVENASLNDTTTATQTSDHGTYLTGRGILTPQFQKSGYTFSGWNTMPDGSGTAYVDGGYYDFSASISLYAIWEKSYHTVTFAENRDLSDSVIATQTSNSSSALTSFVALSPQFANPNQTFLRWNTMSDGSGQSYSDGATYSFDASIVLFAIWSGLPTFHVTLNPNGSIGSPYVINATLGDSVVLPNGSQFSRPGFQFVGWSADRGGSGHIYAAGDSIQVTADTGLYAIWNQVPSSYTVSFDAQGGTVSPASEAYVENGPAIVLPGPYKGEYTFLGWFTTQSGGTKVGGSGTSFVPTHATTLYAHWDLPPVAYTVAFAPGGGSTSISTSNYQVGGALIVLPAASWPTHLFEGWYDDQTAGTLVGVAGQTYAPQHDITLFAHWVTLPADRQYGFIRGFARTSSAPSAVTVRQVKALARAIKSQHLTTVTLWGFSSRVSSVAHTNQLSRLRAAHVLSLLRSDLRALHVTGVATRASGQGLWPSARVSVANCVEVFVR